MKITRTSDLSKKTRTRDLDVTREQLSRWYEQMSRHTSSYPSVEFLADCFPNLNEEEREFIKSGNISEDF